MSTLLGQISARAEALSVPLSAHIDLTWRCNESCVHCYLEHASPGEMTTAEVRRLLDQLASAGALFLSLSGGEIFLRPDVLEIVAHARALLFSVTVKTNGTLLGDREAEALARLAVDQVNISIYSHRAEIHDRITALPGSFERSIAAIRSLIRQGVKTRLMHVVMRPNVGDYPSVTALAAALGAEARFDPCVTPALNGASQHADLRILPDDLRAFLHDPSLIEDVDRFCAPPRPLDAGVLNDRLCAAGIRACYISPVADVMPCVTYPVVCGNIRRQSFLDIWHDSPDLRRIRVARLRDLPVCSQCSNLTSCNRCPGLAHIAGDVLGPSLLDCEKAYARTGAPTPLIPICGVAGGEILPA